MVNYLLYLYLLFIYKIYEFNFVDFFDFFQHICEINVIMYSHLTNRFIQTNIHY